MSVNKIEKIKLCGKRYYLKTLLPDDVSERYLSWLHDPEVNRYLEVRLTKHTLESLREWVSDFDNKLKYLFGIYTKGIDVHIGTVTLYAIHPYHGTAYEGYMVGDKGYWGKGVVLEVLPLIFNFGFNQLGLRKITGGMYLDNVTSIVNCKKLGMKQEACLKSHLRLGDRFVDQLIFSMFKEDWEENPKSKQNQIL
jgi:RimJ/RimL family protein N-acetyltransferase